MLPDSLKLINELPNIVDVEIIPGCGIVVTFSDGTLASYPAEELAGLRPYREPAKAAAPAWWKV